MTDVQEAPKEAIAPEVSAPDAAPKAPEIKEVFDEKKDEKAARFLRKGDAKRFNALRSEDSTYIPRFRSLGIQNIEINGFNLSNARFSSCTFRASRIVNSDLRNTKFEQCFLNDCKFSTCNLSNADITGAYFENVKFMQCDMLDIICQSPSKLSRLNKIEIDNCDMSQTLAELITEFNGQFSKDKKVTIETIETAARKALESLDDKPPEATLPLA